MSAEFLKREIEITLGFSFGVILSLWVFFYLSYSTNGLPVGWDTPYYAWKIETATRSGADAFIATERYYHFLYPLVGSWITAVGLSPLSVEILLPLLLWMLGVLLVPAIVLRELADLRATVFALGAGSTWFAFFRLGSDLHANLMALVTMLVGTAVFLHLHRNLGVRGLVFWLFGFGAVILVSSFSHVETTLFISAVWLLSLFVSLWRKWIGLRRSIAVTLAILLALTPSLLEYLNQLRSTFEPLGGRLPTVSTMSPIIWLAYFGPVGVMVLVAIPLSYKSKLLSLVTDRFSAFSTSWLALSLAIGLGQYAYPPLAPFSERALIMTPTPFLAAMVLPRITKLRIISHVKGVAIVTMIMIAGTGTYYIGIGQVYYQSFISGTASLALQDLRAGELVDPRKAVFVYYEAASEGGGLAEHDDYWTAAYFGNHYAYFGRIDFLMAGIQTPFSDDRSELISGRFFGSVSMNNLSNMSIVYLEEFNIPKPVPFYYLDFLNPLTRGAYLVDQAKWKSQHEVFIPAFSSVLTSTEGWLFERQDWTYTGTALKVEMSNADRVAVATIALAIPKSDDYDITLRMWDTAKPSDPISILVDGNEAGQIRYNGTQTPVQFDVFSGGLEPGVHYLSLKLQNQVGLTQFVSLDYVSVRRHNGPLLS